MAGAGDVTVSVQYNGEYACEMLELLQLGTKLQEDLRALGLWLDYPTRLELDAKNGQARCVFKGLPQSDIYKLRVRASVVKRSEVLRDHSISCIDCTVYRASSADEASPSATEQTPTAPAVTPQAKMFRPVIHIPQLPAAAASAPAPKAIPTAPAALRQTAMVPTAMGCQPPTAPAALRSAERSAPPHHAPIALVIDSRPRQPSSTSTVNDSKPFSTPVADNRQVAPPSPSPHAAPPLPLSTPPPLPPVPQSPSMFASASAGPSRSKYQAKSTNGVGSGAARAPLTVAKSLPENKRKSPAESFLKRSASRSEAGPGLEAGEPSAKRRKAGAAPDTGVAADTGAGPSVARVKLEETGARVPDISPQKLAALNAELEKQTAQIRALEKSMAKQEVAFKANIQNQRTQLKQDAKESYQKLNEVLAVAQEENANLQKTLSLRSAHIEELRGFVLEENALRKEAETEIARLVEALEHRHAQVESAKCAAAWRIEGLEGEKELHVENQRLKRAFEDLERDYEDASDKRRDAQAALKAERDRNDALQADLARAREKRSRWVEAYQDEKVAREEAVRMLEEERGERAKLEAVLAEIKAERAAPFVVTAMVDAFAKLVQLSRGEVLWADLPS